MIQRGWVSFTLAGWVRIRSVLTLTHAWSLGLEKYPAVVFDDKWVVYGTTDTGVATQRLSAWKETAQ